MTGPNPLRVAVSILRARRVRSPAPSGSGTFDPAGLTPALDAVASGGLAGLGDAPPAPFLEEAAAVDPDRLGRTEALAFWINVYNAGALDLAHRARRAEGETVWRVPGAFTAPFIEIGGEALSLDDVEHGKVRRFGDPRIHAALVCGSVSCPTLRAEPYRGDTLEAQLDEQMRSFLAAGGAAADDGGVRLSRIFLWYGGDFTRPHRMPTLAPARRRSVLRALSPWLDPALAAADPARVGFQSYDWGLGCSVRSSPG